MAGPGPRLIASAASPSMGARQLLVGFGWISPMDLPAGKDVLRRRTINRRFRTLHSVHASHDSPFASAHRVPSSSGNVIHPKLVSISLPSLLECHSPRVSDGFEFPPVASCCLSLSSTRIVLNTALQSRYQASFLSHRLVNSRLFARKVSGLS